MAARTAMGPWLRGNPLLLVVRPPVEPGPGMAGVVKRKNGLGEGSLRLAASSEGRSNRERDEHPVRVDERTFELDVQGGITVKLMRFAEFTGDPVGVVREFKLVIPVGVHGYH